LNQANKQTRLSHVADKAELRAIAGRSSADVYCNDLTTAGPVIRIIEM